MKLGIAYRERPTGDRSENRERAIAAFENALWSGPASAIRKNQKRPTRTSKCLPKAPRRVADCAYPEPTRPFPSSTITAVQSHIDHRLG
jgi:hypothetical protein